METRTTTTTTSKRGRMSSAVGVGGCGAWSS